MEYGSQIAFALILGIPVACITWTVTQEDVFQEFRRYLARYQDRHHESWWRRKLAYFPTCPYCLSHYVAGLLIAIMQFKMLATDWRGYLVSLFTLVLLGNVYITLYNLLRVALRLIRALADRAEKSAAGGVQQPASNLSVPEGGKMARPTTARPRNGRSLFAGRRS
jgi:membrane protein required for beta-lactamase induction